MRYVLTFDNDVHELMNAINQNMFEFEKKKGPATSASSTESTIN